MTEVNPAFLVAVVALSIAAGAAASIVGFGIGSLLTPLLAHRFGIEVAVAAVAFPHLAGGLYRGWRLRRSVDTSVLWSFGLLSAVAGLAGAFAFARLNSHALSIVLGSLLLVTASAGITGWSRHWQPGRYVAWLLGALSGFFGGVIGNQGGLRAAGLSVFNLAPLSFVATSTVIGIMIDVARSPIYVLRAGNELRAIAWVIVVATVGVLLGTAAGERLLFGLSERAFRIAVSIAIALLGAWLLVQSLA
jgi:uncharacterized protein